jgi:hypothetical protein
MMSSPVPLTASELQDALGGIRKTAWFLLHRNREALATGWEGSAKLDTAFGQ